MSSSFFSCPGLHNKFTKFTGCQVLTVVFVYAKSPGLSSFEDVKFCGSCKLWQLSNFIIHGSCSCISAGL